MIFIDEKTFRNFISWIENQKIRLYPIEERVSLDNVESDDWNQVYEKVDYYLICEYKG